MKRERLYRLLALAAILITATTVGLSVGGCCDDCPTCPKLPDNSRYDGRLYVTSPHWWDSTGGLFVIDTKTDSIIDSIVYDQDADKVLLSDDGKYLLVDMQFPYWTALYDAASLELVGEWPHIAFPDFAKNSTVLIGTGSKGIVKYSVPDFHLMGTGLLDSGSVDQEMFYCERTNTIYGIYRIDCSGDICTGLFAVDFDSLKERRRWEIPAPNGDLYNIHEMAIHPNGRFAYLLTDYYDGVDFITYSLDSSRIVSTFRMFLHFGDIQVDSVNNLVYVCDPGMVGEPICPGVIYVFEALTGTYRGGISLDGYLTEADRRPPFDAWEMTISPDGNRLYAYTGHMFTRWGTVLDINAKTREIEKLIFPKIDHLFSGLVVGPKPGH